MIKYLIILALALSPSAFAASQDEVVASNELSQMPLDEIGLITQKQGGFAFDMWKGTDGSFAAILLDNIPTGIKSQTIADIENRLLLTAAAKPANWQGADSFFMTRMKHLALSGDSVSIANILRKIPENMRNEKTDSLYTLSLLSALDFENGCKQVQNLVQKYNNISWRKAMLGCLADGNKNNELDLNLRLMKEDGQKPDENFTKLLESLKSKDKKVEARRNFIQVIKIEVFPQGEQQAPFPSIMGNVESVSQDIMDKWLYNLNATTDPAARLTSLIKFYTMLDSAGEKIPAGEWQEITTYALVNKIKLPPIVWEKLLLHAVENGRQAEALLIIIHSIGSEDPANVQLELMDWIISALREMNLDNDARKLLIEVIGIHAA